MMGFLKKFMNKYPAKPAITQPVDPGVFTNTDRIIPDHFAEMSASPREKLVHAIKLENSTALTYFFTPTVDGRGAGVAQDFASKGICSIIDGHSKSCDLQIITEHQMGQIWSLIRAYERYRYFATASIYYRVFEYGSEERLNWEHFNDQALNFERQLADKFNVIADYHTHKTRPTGFFSFEDDNGSQES